MKRSPREIIHQVQRWLLTKDGRIVREIMTINVSTGELSVRKPRFKIVPIFAWYDFWVGAFWDNKKKFLYVFPAPMLGFRIGYQ